MNKSASSSSNDGDYLTVYIGLGANLGNPSEQIHAAVDLLKESASVKDVRISPFYESDAMGELVQQKFVNAVCEIQCSLAPLDLLDLLQGIEKQLGRTQASDSGYVRWGPRPIDLDLLLYNDLELSTERLIIPHPGMANRSFVLLPLRDLAPDLHIPGLGPVEQCVKSCESFGIRRLQ